MPKRIIFLLILFLMSVSLVTIAQDEPAPERQLTATQLVVDATESAQPNQTQVANTPTNEPFMQTATALVIHATQTSQASGGNIPTQATRIDAFGLTATQIITDATATAESVFVAQTTAEIPEAEPISPLILTIVMVVLLVVVLLAISGAFAYMNSRNVPKN